MRVFTPLQSSQLPSGNAQTRVFALTEGLTCVLVSSESRLPIRPTAVCRLAIVIAAGLAAPGFAVVTANPNPSNPVDGASIAGIVGADRFYANGFTGSSATVANVEAGYIWNGHEALGHVQNYFAGTGALGEFDRHGTWVGMILGGRATANGGGYQQGIAYGADLWSGAIATQWFGLTSFDYTPQSLADAYKAVLVTGVNGKTADVTNSSWSDGSDPEAGRYGDYSRAVDAIAAVSKKTLVFSVGNRSNAGTVGTPAAGFNVIGVASLGSDVSSPVYGSVSSFSSRGPQPIFIPNVRNADYDANPSSGTIIPAARAAVDIAAPGENLVSAFYGGTTGGNRNGVDGGGGSATYSSPISGTSFATPIVAGGATLMADAARQRFGNASKALDGRVMKANLLNAADKIAGWNNGQSLQAGVIRTTQALDYASGAGRLNLSKSYDLLLSGTADVAGTGGGIISSIGWDYGIVSQGSPNDYSFAAPLIAGSTLTVTLDWFADREIDLATDATLESSFDDLTLQVRTLVGDMLIAESASAYNEVEHLNFTIPTTAAYEIRVLWAGEVWDLVNDANQTTYGLAWSGTMVPEPGLGLGAVAIIALLRRRK